MAVTPDRGSPLLLNIDLFLTLRYFPPSGRKVFYTGIAGDPLPPTKAWLRVSMRKINNQNLRHSEHMPYRDYL
jgi:hypothetical protein